MAWYLIVNEYVCFFWNVYVCWFVTINFFFNNLGVMFFSLI
jgi:hypothetical protein